MRKKNLSAYDIRHELKAQGHELSINALSVLLREKGFASLPRRRDEERPACIKPKPAEVANVDHLDLTPRTFRTRVAGLFLFVPLMKSLDLRQVAQQARLPGSKSIPAEQARSVGVFGTRCRTTHDVLCERPCDQFRTGR
jgi:hypothetical protein